METKAVSWLLMFLVAAFCLFQLSEARTVQTCYKNADCSRTPCASSYVFCVNGICVCEVSTPKVDESALITPRCSASLDCRFLLCTEGESICRNGVCSCRVPPTSADESAAVTDDGELANP